MDVVLTDDDRAALVRAAAGESRVRVWRRYRGVLLLAEGRAATEVAQTLGCALSSVYHWAAAWRRQGLPGLRGRGHGGGRARALDAAGEARLVALLAEDPQARGLRATGWTAPLLRGELAAAGYALSERTLRRVLHRLGYRWKRPKFVLGRPDPAYEAKRGRSPRAPA